jgi:hypothetical protein
MPATAAADSKPILAERFKTKMCRTFTETGVCPYEARCMFAHGVSDIRSKEMNLAAGLTTETAIRAFLASKSTGTAARPVAADATGDARSTILAERFKTKMCQNYEKHGSCPYEARCMFAHGDADLRTAEQNVTDGLTTEEAIRYFQRNGAAAAQKKTGAKSGSKPTATSPRAADKSKTQAVKDLLAASTASANASAETIVVAALCISSPSMARSSQRTLQSEEMEQEDQYEPASATMTPRSVNSEAAIAPSLAPQRLAATAATPSVAASSARATPASVRRHNPYAPVLIGRHVPADSRGQSFLQTSLDFMSPLAASNMSVGSLAAERCGAGAVSGGVTPRAAPAVSPLAAVMMRSKEPSMVMTPTRHEVLFA